VRLAIGFKLPARTVRVKGSAAAPDKLLAGAVNRVRGFCRQGCASAVHAWPVSAVCCASRSRGRLTP